MPITLFLSFHLMKLIFVFVSKDGSIQQAAGFVLGAALGEHVKAAWLFWGVLVGESWCLVTVFYPDALWTLVLGS